MRFITLIALGLLAFSAAGCASSKPDWVAVEGWQAARCYASAELLAERGDGGAREQLDTWRDLTYAFVGTTDQGMKLRHSAQASMGASNTKMATAEKFFTENCGVDAAAKIRRVL